MDTTYPSSAEFTVPAELRGQIPRRVRLTGSGFQIALAAAILLAFGAAGAVWVAIAAVQQRQHNSALHKSGREIEGAITGHPVPSSVDARVRYIFPAGGAMYSGDARVPEELAHSLTKSKNLLILYLPTNPAINRPAAWQPLPSSQSALLLAPALAVVLGLLLCIPLSIEHRMAAQGRPALAVVRSCTKGRNGYLVKYELRLGDDETAIKGRGWCKSHQEPGNGIWVLYLPGAPRRNLPYPLSYCRGIE